ncbi:glycosyltransferase [Lentzea sp. NPDC054927]
MIPDEAESAQIRVAHFSDTFLPRRDGVIKSVRVLVAELEAAGQRSLLVVPHHRESPAGEIGLALRSLPTGVAGMRTCLPCLHHVRAVGRWRPNVIHVHTAGAVGLLGVLAARSLRVPLVVTYHTDLHAYADAYRIPTTVLRLMLCLYGARLGARTPRPPTRGAVIDAINALLLRPAAMVIAPTAAILHRAPLELPHNRVVVIPTGVAHVPSASDGGCRFRARWAVPPDAPLILFVGRVNAEKGIELLVHAFRHVLRDHRGARLVLVGAVFNPSWLRRLLMDAGVLHNTVVTGQQPEEVVAAAYAAATAFVFPSLTDTQGLVLREAALAGVPTIMVDAHLHAADPQHMATLLARPTAEDLGEAISTVLSDPQLASSVASAACEVASTMTPNTYGRSVLAIYRTIQLGRWADEVTKRPR